MQNETAVEEKGVQSEEETVHSTALLVESNNHSNIRIV